MAKNDRVTEHTCPGCGGVMLSDTADEYCIECYHEGRV